MPFRYDNAFLFSEDVAWVNLGGHYDEQYYFVGGKWGLINKKGKQLIEAKYDDIDAFSQGLAAVKLGGKWGFVNKKGKTAITTQFEGMFAPVFKNGKASLEHLFVNFPS